MSTQTGSTYYASKPRINRVIDTLKNAYELHELAQVTGKDPFKVLIGGILSARTKDTQTAPVCRELFKMADSPAKLLKISESNLAALIKPIGFYNQKGRAVRETCRILIEEFGGKVPQTIDELLTLPGVGRKVANLVLSNAFGKDAICVDTHVHRITNRLGWIDSKDPPDSEIKLMEIVPKKRWREVNFVFVRHGQECCHPVSPFCSRCPVAGDCAKAGVGKSR